MGNRPDNIKDPLPEKKWDEFRELILGKEQADLETLKKKVDNPEAFAKWVAEVLPEAVQNKSTDTQKLTDALFPIIEKSIYQSVKKDSRPMADALFPIMGPAIRKAISETFRDMLQSLNRTLERSLSIKGLKWRIQSVVSGKPFVEIVMLNSMIYRVQQVFLIHWKTGLLLQEASAESDMLRDGDMVSGMLRAIQDFVHDSFQVKDQADLDTVEVGDLTVWVEQGPHAILAGVVHGDAPASLRTIFKAALENIHGLYAEELENFDGNTSPFEKDKTDIENCLQSRVKSAKKKKPVLIWGLFGILIMALAFFIYLRIEKKQRWNAYIEKLKSEPGLLVTNQGKSNGKFFVVGLRDPLSVDPETFLSEYSFNTADISFDWEYYYTLNPDIIVVKAKSVLNPPATVNLLFQNGILFISGAARHQWIENAVTKASAMCGIDSVNRDHLKVTTFEEAEEIIRKIEKLTFLFDFEATRISVGQEDKAENLIEEIRTLNNLLISSDKKPVIQVYGHTDKIGGITENKVLSLRRAEEFRKFMVENC